MLWKTLSTLLLNLYRASNQQESRRIRPNVNISQINPRSRIRIYSIKERKKRKKCIFFPTWNLALNLKVTFTHQSQMTQSQPLTYLSQQRFFWPQAIHASALKIITALSIFLQQGQSHIVCSFLPES